MTSAWSRAAAAIGGLLVGGAFLYLSFRQTPPGAVWAVLVAGHWALWPLLGLLGTALFVYSKAARWRLLLGGEPPVGALVRPVLAGLALNALLPHSGEFVRALALQRSAGRAASGVLSSIVAERVFDLFGVLILAATALLLVPVPVSSSLLAAVRVLGSAAVLLAAGVVLALAAPRGVAALAAVLARPLPRAARDWLLRQVGEALAGLEPVRSLTTSLQVLAWSLCQWLAIAWIAYACAGVAGFDPGFAATCLVVVGIVAAFLLPNAPGYAGSVQIAFLATLRPLGVADDAALAASVVYQLLMVLPVVVLGLACLRSSLGRR